MAYVCVKYNVVKAWWMTSFLNTEQLKVYSCTWIAALQHKHEIFVITLTVRSRT